MKIPLMKKLDAFIFTQIDRFSASGEYQKFQEMLSSLNDHQKKTVTLIIHMGLILLPLVLTSFLWISNISLSSHVKERKELLRVIDKYIGSKDELDAMEKVAFSPSPISDMREFQTRLKSIADRLNIDSSKLSAVNFDSDGGSEGAIKSRAEIKLTGLALNEMVSFISTLVAQEKFKIENIRLDKNEEQGLLFGLMGLIHYRHAGKE